MTYLQFPKVKGSLPRYADIILIIERFCIERAVNCKQVKLQLPLVNRNHGANVRVVNFVPPESR